RSVAQVKRDLSEVLRDSLRGKRFQFDLGSLGLMRPDLSLPAYAGFAPTDGLAPIFNLFDRTGGGRRYTQRVTRSRCRDFRGGRLTYDEHDGTDLVCPVGTPLVAAAPGVVVMIRDRWLRGGLTIAVDHGHGIVTQYTHCSRAMAELGQPVQRGETVALSGASGLDMTQFFPWVPPHVHFMVYVHGRPVDPFLADGEAARAGTWQPLASGPLPNDPRVERPSEVDRAALERVAEACTDARIRAEIAAVEDRPGMLAALLEDAMCHDSWAFSANARLRPGPEPSPDAVFITLPLPLSDYRGTRFADAAWLNTVNR
ncbi:MAG TPA: M23 family metallopeptidase, partial [Polyangiaceae bacterium]|nr:M23 family metallopeptidase [Polyangiaceae bacterium]